MLVPMPRGILATVTARFATDRPADRDDPREVLLKAYADEPFVHVLPEGQWPHTAATSGTDS
jgi:N-acetyl-gamma-glutamyl-phosphate reductase